jgi:hypothetical protein
LITLARGADVASSRRVDIRRPRSHLVPSRPRRRDRDRAPETVEEQALAGDDWGAEAQPKREFETKKDAEAMTTAEFEALL